MKCQKDPKNHKGLKAFEWTRYVTPAGAIIIGLRCRECHKA